MPWKPAFHTVNVGGTLNVAEACAAAPTPPVLVVVSSLAAGGPATEGRPRREEDPPAPVSVYGRVKLDAEAAATRHAASVPVTIVRPPMVYGAGDRSGLKIFRTVSAGWHLVPSRKLRRLSMVRAPDLAELLIRAATRGERVPAGPDAPPGAGVYYAAHEQRPAYDELGRLVGHALGGVSPRVVRMPAWSTAIAANASELIARLRDRPTILNRDKLREAAGGDWTCDPTKAREGLGFRPALTLEEGLADTARWYRQEGWIRS
jgi:nucleoside-diphosphate-sugar epimerase